jgi:hypothetical protein
MFGDLLHQDRNRPPGARGHHAERAKREQGNDFDEPIQLI